MKNNKKLFSPWQFFVFFIMSAFLITCCFLLFFSGIDMPLEIIKGRAIITFLNVIFLSALFTAIDVFRRLYTIKRPITRILDATKKIRQGDFSVRIPSQGISEFDIIIDDINSMTEELSGIETLRSDFISNVSHELKTPLAVIQNYSAMLQNPNLTQNERDEYVKVLLSTSRRLSNLITNILKLNKLENQQIFPNSKKYDLSEQLCECLLGFEISIEEKELNVETDIDLDIYINSDSELLALVWNNVISNAVKFTDKGGKITVSLKKENNFAVVKISDTGCGISPETGKHIFEKFYQGDKSHAMQGNGLGLALVKRIIDIVQGEIELTSEVGKGSIFTVKLRCNDNEVSIKTNS